MTNWRKAMEVFNTHVGGVASAHNDARTQLEAFQNQRQSVSHLLQARGRGMEVAYRPRLTTTLDVTRFLLKQGLPFRGHDESLSSSNKGNFLELIEWYTQRNDEVAKTMNENAPGNNQMESPTVQKDLTRSCAAEVTNVILNDIEDNIFSLMIDECRDISVKEQIRVVLRYVNKHGCVIERFLAIVHVSDTSAISLKKTIDELFAKYKLSLSRLRGQGYDGALNMRGEYNGLKALILKDNSSARYVHCFAHQLQLVVVAVAKSNRIVSDFFQYVTMIVNITGASCKRKDKFKQLEHDRLVECLEKGDIVLDMIVQEMNNRFSKSGTEVLTCIACLDPKDSFSQFDIGKLLHLAELYPEDFSLTDRVILEDQLETYIQNVRALVLPVATVSVERVFSTMKIIKTDLHNRMGDEWMNDSLESGFAAGFKGL
ncbi:zinc finger MYM-type protein 1-like [Zingiber officinale]|uniref:zinc finger MYM-type protein 1-like n=1 Tax=Zingiber officinale TaxID=94328 RepID=UPI001C4ADCE0|nr:zinc finger MYM-type protein 1-like [Zingiber officinale]